MYLVNDAGVSVNLLQQEGTRAAAGIHEGADPGQVPHKLLRELDVILKHEPIRCVRRQKVTVDFQVRQGTADFSLCEQSVISSQLRKLPRAQFVSHNGWRKMRLQAQVMKVLRNSRLPVQRPVGADNRMVPVHSMLPSASVPALQRPEHCLCRHLVSLM